MTNKKIKRPWIAYPGSCLQNNFGEDQNKGFLIWDIQSKSNFSVKFEKLPILKPFLTINFSGDEQEIYNIAKNNPEGSRFKIKSINPISYGSRRSISFELKEKYKAGEIIFEEEFQLNEEFIKTNELTISKDDLSLVSSHMKLLQEFYKETEIDNECWSEIENLLTKHINSLSSAGSLIKNSKWTIKELKFDNLFSYGEENIINFENLNGITGIFGRNKLGKSSIIGAISYALFNSSDRGTLKNLEMVNERKKSCKTEIKISVNEEDFLIKRETKKIEKANGQIAGPTSVEFFKIIDGIEEKLSGEQRTDTDKIIRNLIGTEDDFVFTSLSAQNDMNNFIKEGSTQRKAILSKFLGLDIFDKIYTLCKKEYDELKIIIKSLPQKNSGVEINSLTEKLINNKNLFLRLNIDIEQAKNELRELQTNLLSLPETIDHNAILSVESDINKLTIEIQNLISKRNKNNQEIFSLEKELMELSNNISNINIQELKEKFEQQSAIESSLIKLEHDYEINLNILNNQKKSAKKLLEVPCEDKFPNCKFIKDSYIDKQNIDLQNDKVKNLLEEISKIKENFNKLKIKDLKEIIKLHDDNENKIRIISAQLLNFKNQNDLNNDKVNFLENALQEKKAELESLKLAENKERSSERQKISFKIKEYDKAISELENLKIKIAHENGMLEHSIKALQDEKQKCDDLIQKMKPHEYIMNAFSKRAVPHLIISKQLPAVNQEISNILAPIFDFNITMECGLENNDLDVHINYDGNKRIIELCSGSEKMIASLAIRTALYMLSCVPKSDFLIIDELYGLDSYQVESCCNFIKALKPYFKHIIIISHVDEVKSIVDQAIEITKVGENSKVNYGI